MCRAPFARIVVTNISVSLLFPYFFPFFHGLGAVIAITGRLVDFSGAVDFSNDFSGDPAETALSNSSTNDRDADDFRGVVKLPSVSAGSKGALRPWPELKITSGELPEES